MTFQEYRFINVASLINGRAYLMPELQDSGKYKIVRVGNFTGKDEWFFSDMELEPEKYCENGDLLYKWACTFGPEIWKGDKTIYHYHIWKVLCNPVLLDKTFFFYYLKYYTPLWLSGTNGATMVHITKASMEKKKLYLPTLPEQQKIASILSAYDSQIENNQKRIKLLEQMAENLYKEWFVRFRFPGYENTEFEGGVPKGWCIKKLNSVSDIVYGFPFNSNYFCSDSSLNPVVRIRDIADKHTETYTPEKPDDKYLIHTNDILIGMDGIFHMNIWTNEGDYLNQRVVKVSSKVQYLSNLYLFYSLYPQVKMLESIISGTTVAHLSAKDMNKMTVLIPSDDVLKLCFSRFENILSMRRTLLVQNDLLTTQRDLLLPRLMSGKLTINV